MSVNLHHFLRFASDHDQLLVDLFHRSGPAPEGEVFALIARAVQPDTTPEFVFRRLLELRILSPAPEADASYELTGTIRELVAYVLKQQRLKGSAEIEAYVRAFSDLATELDEARANGNETLADKALRDVLARADRLRYDSEANSQGTITEVSALRSNREHMPVRLRFEVINRLWTKYLEPLRAILEPDGAMDTTLERVERVLVACSEAFPHNRPLASEMLRARVRLTALRRAVAADHRESIREVEPMYRQVTRDARIVQGAARALEAIRAGGMASAPCIATLDICVEHGSSGLLCDSAVEAYLHGVRDYEPKPPEPIAAGPDREEPAFINARQLRARLAASVPIHDVIAFLAQEFPTMDNVALLRAYGWIHDGDYGEPSFPCGSERAYTAGLHAHPMSLLAVVTRG